MTWDKSKGIKGLDFPLPESPGAEWGTEDFQALNQELRSWDMMHRGKNVQTKVCS